ncbi:Acetyl-coenzyme A carboxyl transferase alpha chain [Candidatus Syntrophocurvum alkaliphilum]|uniref:Acetyl-coenzyme A carboxylase carboxyl transferase subunit alpha n=1 Tax=Candidatus Syntrophocurvum alkaliphilum TaxID=2293317 RepID=A0A6I6DDM3_9FIRM|nr:acetyl-CoA carboxylase carboxyltransferase subunit alpha [Candidatus Syntrophocurvum alkaliphilum]QGT98708.1 Acetyl-coenzyme A carboxyl transferase alpha chain [Candidatus Syntrophocurvum alkaliphilum]
MGQTRTELELTYQLIEEKIEELKKLSSNLQYSCTDEITALENKLKEIKKEHLKSLSAWEKVVISRSLNRPMTSDYIKVLFDGWVELHGDRHFGDDPAIIGGLAYFNNTPVTVIGHQKGKNTKENIKYNFGMPHPEGFRKANRLLLQAEKFKRPVITFINTPGAYPGEKAEERGQAWAISQSLLCMSSLKVPIISVFIGEGGSGGALALSVADRTIMLSNSVFSIASPEACASILFKDISKAPEIAASLKLTASDLKELEIIDEIIEEPTIENILEDQEFVSSIRNCITNHLDSLMVEDFNTLPIKRYEKLKLIGNY